MLLLEKKAYICAAKRYSNVWMSGTYLAYYESLIIHMAPGSAYQLNIFEGVCLLQAIKDQQRNTVQECDANEAQLKFSSRAHKNKKILNIK